MWFILDDIVSVLDKKEYILLLSRELCQGQLTPFGLHCSFTELLSRYVTNVNEEFKSIKSKRSSKLAEGMQ